MRPSSLYFPELVCWPKRGANTSRCVGLPGEPGEAEDVNMAHTCAGRWHIGSGCPLTPGDVALGVLQSLSRESLQGGGRRPDAVRLQETKWLSSKFCHLVVLMHKIQPTGILKPHLSPLHPTPRLLAGGCSSLLSPVYPKCS